MPDTPASLASPLALLLAAALGYLLGSIPFGLIVTRLAGLGDIRQIGSGNIGTTNVLRTGRKDLAAATLLLDAAKGAVALLLARAFWGPEAALVAGFAAFIGHIFPIWLRFRGGKGVATYLGLLAASAWPVALVFAAVWVAVAVTTRFSSLSALVASLVSPIVLVLLDRQREAALFAVLTLILWIMHRANIGRLIAGRESRIGHKA
ncbi:glycerol-3-phosphate 1-O-acyltransferase PlsY [Labrys wisconsinensis]|uniref:Glycerol-3-phosphate acyltransferase n=1 Tax=Labrys wisconsinensis TaxID=425677 RepID=A0ABU0J356_9HYPH|nr:glycerol-3-phosphate 1-O-acyltransferase PlsY [Labrys wisconsinensis]MDQ0468699.1 glycerol-3-phosphate acyltransferase PlsY [Labrys wisconsinensis]